MLKINENVQTHSPCSTTKAGGQKEQAKWFFISFQTFCKGKSTLNGGCLVNYGIFTFFYFVKKNVYKAICQCFWEQKHSKYEISVLSLHLQIEMALCCESKMKCNLCWSICEIWLGGYGWGIQLLNLKERCGKLPHIKSLRIIFVNY